MPEDHAPLDYNQITPLIYIGKNTCCTLHFDEGLIAKGIATDISLEEERVDKPFGVQSYLWLPTPDHKAMTHENADLGVQTLQFFEEHELPCYVHCKNGHGRAPMLVASFFISKGMSAEEAVAKIKDRRPVIHLQDEQLRFLDERVKRA